MALVYSNKAKIEIIQHSRDIRYASGQMMFGFYNTIEIECQLKIDITQIRCQADIFAREILTHRSKFDLKRFLGQYQNDWLRLLHETYVYDRLKCIYYGINYVNYNDIPSGLVSFPGNIMLLKFLCKRSFNFFSNDQQPSSIFVTLKVDDDIEKLFEEAFDIYPSVKDGLSGISGSYVYVNARYESIMKGLFSAKSYLDANLKSKDKQNKDLFFIDYMNTNDLDKFFVEDSNPIINSFLNEDGNRFYFIRSNQVLTPEALRFDESTFLARAIGLTSNQVTIFDNPMYTVVKRAYAEDPLTREEVYSITGLKSEMVPYTIKQIEEYLKINSYDMAKNGFGGDSYTTP